MLFCTMLDTIYKTQSFNVKNNDISQCIKSRRTSYKFTYTLDGIIILTAVILYELKTHLHMPN